MWKPIDRRESRTGARRHGAVGVAPGVAARSTADAGTDSRRLSPLWVCPRRDHAHRPPDHAEPHSLRPRFAGSLSQGLVQGKDGGSSCCALQWLAASSYLLIYAHPVRSEHRYAMSSRMTTSPDRGLRIGRPRPRAWRAEQLSPARSKLAVPPHRPRASRDRFHPPRKPPRAQCSTQRRALRPFCASLRVARSATSARRRRGSGSASPQPFPQPERWRGMELAALGLACGWLPRYSLVGAQGDMKLHEGLTGPRRRTTETSPRSPVPLLLGGVAVAATYFLTHRRRPYN
jgi:hypothetical protein